jgi:hypothetical protein
LKKLIMTQSKKPKKKTSWDDFLTEFDALDLFEDGKIFGGTRTTKDIDRRLDRLIDRKPKFHPKTLQTISQVNEVIEEGGGGPFTLRQIYYQLVSKNYIVNEDKQYSRLSDICTKGRENGLIPEEAFEDRTRPYFVDQCWDTVSEFFSSVKESYRKDVWKDQKNYIEVWLEKDALLGVVKPVTDELGMGLQGGRGFFSYTSIYNASKRFHQAHGEGKECYLLYAGDLDPSGIAIPDALPDKFSWRHHADFIHFDRIALTVEQAQKYKLPAAIPKRKDTRTKGFIKNYGDIAVELDALPAKVLQGIISDKVKALMDLDKFEKALKVEGRDKKKLHKIIDEIQKRK